MINGQKIWTSTAREADMMFALIRTEPDAKKHEGISYLVFPMSTPGIEVRPLHTLTGNAEFNEVFFTDVRVPKSSLVGQARRGLEDRQHHAASRAQHAGQHDRRPSRCSPQLVALMKAEGAATARARSTRPVLRDRLTRLEARVLAMKYHALRLLTCQLRGETPGRRGADREARGLRAEPPDRARSRSTRSASSARSRRSSPHVRAHGAWPNQWMFALGLIIGGGTAQIQKNIIAERGLGLPREPKAA